MSASGVPSVVVGRRFIVFFTENVHADDISELIIDNEAVLDAFGDAFAAWSRRAAGWPGASVFDDVEGDVSVSVGQAAPDFTLPGTGDRDYTLSSYRGQPVVLVFYPGDNTAVCTTQLKSYTADFDEFEGVDAQILAISPQDVTSHEGFSQKHGFKFPLLADTDKAVGTAYGVLGPIGFYRRSVFVVDKEGVIRYAHRAVAGLTYKSTGELVKAVRAAS